ncbi:MAG: type II toxin-antitoxin system Phd/YefM family antitoxin [Candidatus Chisholmbacteria bacterium]|nr:type II toxin-antitoxin system Phd/YefM family antitoxin [Candidatus Chisholmbacteria bacterium]
MEIVNIHQAKTHLSKLIAQVEKGKPVVIGKSGKPVAKITPYIEKKVTRKPGAWKGKVWVSPNFDDEDPEINKLFYGEK